MTYADMVAIAFLLDLWWGDPRWLPHPVSLIAKGAKFLEKSTRRLLPAKLAGIITLFSVLSTTGVLVWGLVYGANRVHPYVGQAVSTLLLYTCLATKSLLQHARAVLIPLQSGDLDAARHQVAMIVGRDTETMDEQAVIRATLESVGENTVDGIIAPLFFGFLGGPIGAMVYKAASTLDSLFGYRNDRYRHFGWASARFDDLLAWLPARITGPAMIMVGILPGFRMRHGLEIYRRDRCKHPSPNAAHGEAALAGLLGVQLGGPSTYDGQVSQKPYLGDPLEQIETHHITKANRLVFLTALLMVMVGWHLTVLAQNGY